MQTAFPAISGLDDASRVRIMLYQSGQLVHAPALNIGLQADGQYIQSVDDRAALKALDTTTDTVAYLTESGREGTFIWTLGDFSAEITADTQEGVYIKADAVAATVGAWVKAGVTALRLAADFGAVSDQSTDALAAFTGALSLSRLKKLPIIVDGQFLLSARVVFDAQNSPITILGNGTGASGFLWPDTELNPGLDFTLGNQLETLTLMDMRLLTSGLGTGTAIKVNAPLLDSYSWRGPTIQGIDIGGADVFNDCWDVGLDLVNCGNTRASDITLQGRTYTPGGEVVGTVGVRTVNCTGSQFSRMWVHGFGAGFNFGNDVGEDEGITLTDFGILSCTDGILYRTPLAEAGCQITNGHINVFRHGVDLFAKHVGFLHNLDIYKILNSTQSFNAIVMQNCNNNTIRDILVGDSAGTTGSLFGVFLVDGNKQNKIYNIYSPAATTVDNIIVFGGAGNDDNVIYNIDNRSNPPVGFLSAQTLHLRNSFDSVMPEGETTFADADATPSVGNAFNDTFLTANTGATTITNFDDTIVGQEWSVQANDANTTIQHNAGLLLGTGANTLMPAGGIMRFRKFSSGGVIREINRSF